MFRPHPFTWRPARDGARHATAQNAPNDGTRFEALCGAMVTADCNEVAWLHPTCDDCNSEAHRLAEVPMPVAGAL